MVGTNIPEGLPSPLGIYLTTMVIFGSPVLGDPLLLQLGRLQAERKVLGHGTKMWNVLPR